jgi:hypothetical protein|tara:strand:- start:384 stop:530 length:147 start_codon:yes stop_codon:yes gene_type:complete
MEPARVTADLTQIQPTLKPEARQLMPALIHAARDTGLCWDRINCRAIT